MLSEMSATELFFWEQQGEILGDERADYRSGLIAAQIANWAGRCMADGNTLNATDFMPYYEAQDEDPEIVLQKLDLALGAIQSTQLKGNEAATDLPKE